MEWLGLNDPSTKKGSLNDSCVHKFAAMTHFLQANNCNSVLPMRRDCAETRRISALSKLHFGVCCWQFLGRPVYWFYEDLDD